MILTLIIASLSGDGRLAQLELEGAELHGLQADGRVVGQRSAGVHEGERDGLQQLHLQVPEQPRHAQLQREDTETEVRTVCRTIKATFLKICRRFHRMESIENIA